MSDTEETNVFHRHSYNVNTPDNEFFIDFESGDFDECLQHSLCSPTPLEGEMKMVWVCMAHGCTYGSNMVEDHLRNIVASTTVQSDFMCSQSCFANEEVAFVGFLMGIDTSNKDLEFTEYYAIYTGDATRQEIEEVLSGNDHKDFFECEALSTTPNVKSAKMRR